MTLGGYDLNLQVVSSSVLTYSDSKKQEFILGER